MRSIELEEDAVLAMCFDHYAQLCRAGLFSRPPKGEINANTTGGTRKHKGRLDTATTPPAEASGVSGAMPTVRKEEGVVLVRDRVRLVRSGRGVAG